MSEKPIALPLKRYDWNASFSHGDCDCCLEPVVEGRYCLYEEAVIIVADLLKRRLEMSESDKSDMKDCCERQKYWRELSPEEKIERMRSEVKHLQTHLSSMTLILEQLQEHQHLDGAIVLRMHFCSDSQGTRFNRRRLEDEDAYF